MNWNDVGGKLRAATIASFDALQAEDESGDVYAICLLTDDGAMSVGFSANSEAHFVARRAEEAEEREMTASFEAYLRWDPAEYAYEDIGDDAFEQANAPLIAAATSDDGEGDNADVHLDHLIDAMIDALANLRAERGDALAKVTLFVTVTDSEQTEEVENRSAERLNPPELAAPFLRRYD
jgi:hypothetical protein